MHKHYSTIESIKFYSSLLKNISMPSCFVSTDTHDIISSQSHLEFCGDIRSSYLSFYTQLVS